MKTNTAENKNSKISIRILVLVAGGMDVKTAVNTVLGAGAFEKVAGEVYDALKA